MKNNDLALRIKDDVAIEYSKNWEVRSILTSLVPVIGSLIDIKLTSKATLASEIRFSNFIDTIQEEMNHIDKAKLNTDFIESLEFYDIITTISAQSNRLNDSKRIKAVARMLAESLEIGYTTNIPQIDLINVLSEMSESEASLLGQIGYIYKNHQDLLQGQSNDLFVIDKIRTKLTSEIARNADFLCSRLVSRGLLSSFLNSNFKLTLAGEELLKYFNTQCL